MTSSAVKEDQAICKTCPNHNCLIKKHSGAKKLAPFVQNKHNIQCKSKQQFILEGSPVYGLYFVYQGIVKVSQTNQAHREHIIRISTSGEIIGHRGFGTGDMYQVNAVAIENTSLCYFSTEEFKGMLHAHPPLLYDFMIFYADQLQRSEANTRKLIEMSVREKVLNTFHFLYRKFGQTNSLLNLKLQRKEIAEYAGTSEEQVIKVISQLKKENVLCAEGRLLGVANINAIENEIKGDKFLIDS